ncbi:MAG: hypothetical protein ACRBK7_01815 [Acidimicrobiales bacterium]
MTANPEPHEGMAPIVCTLTEDQSERQLLEWHELRGRAAAVVAIDGGAAMTFPASIEHQIRDLAARESACCAFLNIDVQANDKSDTIRLEVTSSNPEAFPVIAALAGIPAA